MKLNLPFEQNEIPGIRFHVNDGYLFVEEEAGIVAFEVDSLNKTDFWYEKKSRTKKVFQYGDCLYFVDNASILKPGVLISVNLKELKVENLGQAFFKMLVYVGKIDEELVFSVDNKYFAKCKEDDVHEFKLERIFEKPFPINNPFVCDGKIFCVGMGRDVACFDAEGVLCWEKNLNEIVSSEAGYDASNLEIGRCVKAYNDKIYLNLNSADVVCIDSSGNFVWRYKDVDVKGFGISEDGKLYLFNLNQLCILDANSGKLIAAGKLDPNVLGKVSETPLMYFEVTDTHAWCAFSGKGLAAINLNSFSVDWHGFDGATINRELKFWDNRLYIQVASNGIGIGGSPVKEFVLVGDKNVSVHSKLEIDSKTPF